MKKLLTICLLMATLFTVKAQGTKKYFAVFETQHATARTNENNADNWKPEVPYKNFVRIVIGPYDAPIDVLTPIKQEYSFKFR